MTDIWPTTTLPLATGEGSVTSDLSAVISQFQFSGRFPHRRQHTAEVKGKRDDLLAALPTPHEVIASTKDMTICLGESWAAEIRVGSRDSTYLTVVATSAEGAERILVALKAALPAIPERAARDVDFRFWSMSYGPKTRVLHAQDWSEIRSNYARSVQAPADKLMSHTSLPTAGGKLIVLAGPSGTGKTTFLRSLARRWSWATTHVVTDTEKFLGDHHFMQAVVTYEDADDDDGAGVPGGSPRILIVEDAGQLLEVTRQTKSEEAISRLLNLTDGLMGATLNMCLVISTNLPATELNPALLRPGRCLADLQVPALSPAEASAWLGAPVSTPQSLAELYALRGTIDPPTTTPPGPPPATGQYL